jgi:hypothetical protein
VGSNAVGKPPPARVFVGREAERDPEWRPALSAMAPPHGPATAAGWLTTAGQGVAPPYLVDSYW